MNAYEWGIKHNSCKSALELRKQYYSQKEWYKACDRGDWLLWQLNQLPNDQYPIDKIHEILIKIVNRAITKYVLHCEVPSVEQWAVNWLNGIDRTGETARLAWSAAGLARSAETVAEAAVELAETADIKSSAELVAESAATAAIQSVRLTELVAMGSAELKLQANDIHSVIPEWIWD